MAMNNKGVLFTIGLTLLVLTIFTLAVMIYKNYKISEERTADEIIMERTANIFSSVENSIRNIYYNTSFMAIRANGTRVIFYPFDFRYLSTFHIATEQFDNFLSINYTFVNLSRNYDQNNIGFFVKNSTNGNILNYTINDSAGIKTGIGTVTQNISRIVIYYYSATQNGTAQWISTASGSVSVSIIAEGNGSYRSEATASLDPYAISTGRIIGLDGNFNITLTAGIIQVQTNSTDVLNAYNSFYYSPTSEKVFLPADITVNFDDKTQKKGFARIM